MRLNWRISAGKWLRARFKPVFAETVEEKQARSGGWSGVHPDCSRTKRE
jgi:hypothetical protein